MQIVVYVVCQILAMGTQYGRVYVWDIDVPDPALAR